MSNENNNIISCNNMEAPPSSPITHFSNVGTLQLPEIINIIKSLILFLTTILSCVTVIVAVITSLRIGYYSEH